RAPASRPWTRARRAARARDDSVRAPSSVQEVAQDERELLLHLAAGDDVVEHAVLEQELRALEPLGELLADGLLDDARPGEADERARLGEVHVAEESEARRHAAGGRVPEHRDERDRQLAEPPELAHGLGHLHERERALLHPR